MSDQEKSKDLRDQLSGLWRSTVDQLDGLKDVIIRQSHVGRKKIDTAMLRRQRDKFLQDLGELVLKQVENEAIDLGPEGLRLVERVREIDDQIGTAESEISRIHQGETPESTGEFVAIQPDDEPAAEAAEASPSTEEAAVEPEPEPVSEPEPEPEPEQSAPEQDAEPQEAAGDDEQAVDESETSGDKEAVKAAEEAEPAKPKKRTRRAPRKRTSKAKPKADKED